jgi:hypothetical protein
MMYFLPIVLALGAVREFGLAFNGVVGVPALNSRIIAASTVRMNGSPGGEGIVGRRRLRERQLNGTELLNYLRNT